MSAFISSCNLVSLWNEVLSYLARSFMIYFLDAICQVSMDGYSVSTGAFFQF